MMKQGLKERYPEVAIMLDLYCHANNFDMDKFKYQLQVQRWRERNPTFREDFKRVIDESLITMEEHLRLTEVDFETDDELFEYLQKIFDCVYHSGPDPYAMDVTDDVN